MTDRRQIERWIGAVLLPEVRVAGTRPGAPESVPSREYLERFPPAGVVAFGRTPSGAVSPTHQIERVKQMCRELGNPEPFVCCDLEQGAGLHFAEATRLPPALALASASFIERAAVFAAAQLTGMEALECGVEVVLAPVCDVNTRGDNPIIAVRSFGDEPGAAAKHAQSFALSLMNRTVAVCAKHFPGHGDTSQDSHVELPRVDRDSRGLHEVELFAYRWLVYQVDAIMVAHLDVPALTGEPGLPCTLSTRAIQSTLRDGLHFPGAVLSDAMDMGALRSQPDRYVRAVDAGCDGLLCPHDAWIAATELLDAVASRRLSVERLELAAQRVVRIPQRARSLRAHRPRDVDQEQRSRITGLADLALRCSPSPWPWPRGGGCAVLDALPASETPEVVACLAKLRAELGGASDGERAVLPVICELRAWAGRYGLGSGELVEIERRIEDAARRGQKLALAWFGSPQTLPERLWRDPRVAILLAFAPTPPMFDAVARVLAGTTEPGRGSLPTRLG